VRPYIVGVLALAGVRRLKKPATKLAKLGKPAVPGIETPPVPAAPGAGALATVGYTTYRSRSATLFIDDPLIQQLQGRNAEATIDRMLLDPVIAGIIERTSLTLRSAAWTIEPGGPADLDKRFADRLSEDLDELETGWTSTVASMADALAWGFSLFEVLFRQEPDGYHWADFSPREQRSIDHWDIDDSTARLLQVWQRVQVVTSRFGGVRSGGRLPLPGWKLLHFRTHPASGRPEGRSLIRNAFIAWADKQELRRLVKVGLRRDFTGVAKYQVPTELLSKGATTDQKAALAQAVQMVQEFERDQREGLVVPSETIPSTGQPSGYKFDLVSSGGRRQLEMTELWTLHNREIAIGLMAEFVLLGHESVGTQALGGVKVGFFERAINAWLDIIAELMSHKAAATYQIFNPQFATAERPKFIHGDIDKQSLTEIGQFMQQVLGGGGITPDPALEQWLRQQIGAPQLTTDAPQPDPGATPPAPMVDEAGAAQDAGVHNVT